MENHLIIGLGGTGGKIIRSIKALIKQNYTDNQLGEVNIDYLYLDTSNDDTKAALSWKYQTDSIALAPSNILHISNTSLSSYINSIDSYPAIKPWLGTAEDWGNVLPVGEVAAGQKRRYGKFLLSCEVDKFINALNGAAQSLIQRTPDRLSNITFHVCCGLAGGTGSGTIVDVIAQIRKAYSFDHQNFYNAIYAYTLLPELTPTSWDSGTYHANGYAALKELNELSFLKYKPYDIADKSKRSLRIGQDQYMPLPDVFFNGCYVFTNQNANNVQLKVNDEVPDLAGTFIYKKIFSVTNSEARSFINKLARCENGMSEPEEDVDDPGSPKRGRRFLTFGIKRIGIPEVEIKSYTASVFGRQAIQQLLYNNWFDGNGYTDEPKQKTFKEYVEADENLKRWYLTDLHLVLSKVILDADRNRPSWLTFAETWERKRNEFNSIPDNRTIQRDNWINEVKRKYEIFYTETFRGQGVHTFFQLKENDIVDTVNYIIETIEHDLFSLWQKGELGLTEVDILLNDLIISIERRKAIDLNTKIQGLEKLEKESINNIEMEDENWNKIAWAIDAMFNTKRKSFERQNQNLETLYRTRTHLRGCLYAKKLALELVVKLNALSTNIAKIKSHIDEALSVAKKNIDIKCQDAGPRVSDHFVKFYESSNIRDAAKKLSWQADIQKQQSADFRRKLNEVLEGKNNFTQYLKKFTEGSFADLLDKHSLDTVTLINQQLHDKIEGGKRIFDISITEKLREQYEKDIEGLNKFIRELVNQSAVFAQYTPVQENLDSKTLLKREFMVILPIDAKPEGNNSASFNHKLKEAFITSIAGGISENNIIYTEEKGTEITLLNIHNLFPLRFLSAVQLLKAKYNETINNPVEAIRKRAAITLHTEGNAKNFVDLFPIERKKDEILPFIILADALAIIKRDKNPITENMEYVITPDNIMDDDIVLGSNLIKDYVNCSFKELDTLKKRVEKILSDQYKSNSKMGQLCDSITQKVQLFLEMKLDNRRDEEFLQYKEACNEALKILK